MSRRKKTYKREVDLDPVYQDLTAAKFINKVMKWGKKVKAQNIFYNSLEILKEKNSDDTPLAIFKKAVENCKPALEVRSRRVGGAIYQVPVDVRSSRKLTLALRWIVASARRRKGKTMSKSLASELLEAYKGQGNAVKKKEEIHRMAEANKAFSHYNW